MEKHERYSDLEKTDNVVDSFLAQRVGNTAMEASKNRLLSEEELEKYADAFRAEMRENAPKQIKKVANEIFELELDYQKQVKRSDEKGQPHIPKNEFLMWEDDYANLWREIENQRYKGRLDSYQEAEAEEPMFFTQDEEVLSQTIEAQAGIFYAEREQDLLNAITANGNNKDEYSYVVKFAESVSTHLDYKYMSREEIEEYGYDRYERDRTKFHNYTIRHLNGLNHLAEKYGTRRFTPRDFWTSEVPKSQQTPAMAKRMRYDRDLVEEYYNHAFRREAERRKAKLERALRYGFGY